MPLSGITSFNLTRNQIINAALMEAGVIGSEEVPNSSDVDYASLILNAMMKSWEAEGVGSWTQTEGTLFLVPGQAIYSIGTPNPANASSVNVVETTLSVAASAAATTITPVSLVSTGASFPATMIVGDNIAIQLSTGRLQWTTITSIVGSVVHLNAALTASAAIGASVYSYTNVMSRPFNISQVRYRNSQGIDRDLRRFPGRDDYFSLPDKDTQSDPLSFYYDSQLNNGTLFLWPCPVDMSGRVKFTFIRTVDDLVNTTDNPDFPQEYVLPLIKNLAAHICPTYNKEQKLQVIGPIADMLKRTAQGWNIDEGSIILTPENDND